MPSNLKSVFSNPTVFLAVGLMFVIVMMVLPMPSWVLDVGLSASFAFAILIFTITLFIERPLDFSSFPSVLLAALLLRLSLNISSTKLILSAGAISHAEASERRTTEQEETAFLGSLDGVSKFMKGDAVAGILITLLNLIAGIGIGVGVHGISLGEAVKNYSVLTVGDGLVSQIPAVIISIAAGLLLSKGRGEGTVDFALFKQFRRVRY